eukprot:16442426-Heterocapsa_arctica.AAC.1
MSAFMAYMPRTEPNMLSKLGAVRLSRKDANKFLKSQVSTQNYHAVMITYSNGTVHDCLGYLLYEDMGNKAYAMALKPCIQDEGALWLREDKKGDVMECIFALGYIYQTRACQALEGIMELA